MSRRYRRLRRPRTTAERRAFVGARLDARDGETPPLRCRPRPCARDDLHIAALRDRSRRLPRHLRPQESP